MTHLIQLPLASFLDLSGAEIGIVFAVLGMFFGGVMGLAGMYFHHQRQRLWHETARVALERGQPVPPQSGDEPSDHAHGRGEGNDVRAGLILIAVGFGLFLFFSGMRARELAFIGAIPGLIGAALLLYGLSKPKKKPVAQDRPPLP